MNEKINAMNLTTELVPVTFSFLTAAKILSAQVVGWPVHRTTELNIAPVRMHFSPLAPVTTGELRLY